MQLNEIQNICKCCKEYEKILSKDDYELFLSEQGKNSYYGAFRASVYYNKRDTDKAKTYIDKAVSLLEDFLLNNPKNNPLISEDNSCFFNIYRKIYELAGEIYAKCDDHDKSLLYYQKYQYYTSQLSSDFRFSLNGGVVYSFRRVSVYSLSDLIANSITVVYPSKMNDPFDSLFTFWASKENLEDVCNEKKHISSYSESFNSYRIRSFVGNNNLTADEKIVNNIIMWSHYADEHKGYCIRYKLSYDFMNKPFDGEFAHHYLKKVKYITEGEAVSVVSLNTDAEKLFTTKSEQWSRESEVRLVSYDSSHDGDYLQLKLDNRSKIDEIYFGYRCSESDQRTIMSVVGEKVDYYKMELNRENVYSMLINKIKYNPY